MSRSKKFGFLLDMDGVIYRGNQLIPGAKEFVARLRNDGTPFRFLTNNSQRTRRDVALKLRRLGLFAEESDVFTCAMATARFLAKQKPHGTAFVIGENGLAVALQHNGYTVVDDDADYVVVGEGRTLTIAMIERAPGRQAFAVGKPSGVTMRMAQDELGTRSANTVIVGTQQRNVLQNIHP